MLFRKLVSVTSLLVALVSFGGWTDNGMAQESLELIDEEAPQAGTEKVAAAKKESGQANKESDKGKKAKGWIPLLPKQGLEGWKITDFGEKGKVAWDGKVLIIEMGDPLNGINYTKKDFPKDNYEIYWEANRLDGGDFLCGLTFPIKDQYCSFIAGGWGGGLVGLSSVDGFDASENSTTTFADFENNKWYSFKLRVDPEYIRAWIDGEEYFRQEREDRDFDTRIEVEFCKPLGYCTYQSKAAVREFKWRPIGKLKEKMEAEKKEQPKVQEVQLQIQELDKDD